MRRAAGMGGGSVLRAVGRAVGSGIKDSVSGTIDAVTFSSSSRSSATAIMSAATRGSTLCFCEGEEWESIEREDENVEREDQFERFVFEPVPSVQEAEEAVSTIRQVFVPIPFGEIVERSSHGQETKDTATISTKILPRSLSTESQSDWIEPAMHLYSSKNGQSHEREKVLDAFRLLQFNPSIQKIVVSLSSDTAVWDAVMKNEAVQEFKKLFYEARIKQQDPDEEDLPQPANGLLKWIVSAKVKIMEILDRVAKHFNYIFLSSGVNKHENDHFDNVIRSSLMLSVLVFIVVIICRVQRS